MYIKYKLGKQKKNLYLMFIQKYNTLYNVYQIYVFRQYKWLRLKRLIIFIKKLISFE